MECHRHRDRHVDADHADLNLMRKLSRGISIAREDRRTVTEFVLVDEAYRRRAVGRSYDGENRPENLLLIDRHLRGHSVEKAAADEIALLVALQSETSPVDDKRGSLGNTGVDVAPH